MTNEVSTTRLYLLRVMYLLNFVMLGMDVWPKILQPGIAWDPVKGAAYSLWAALSLISVLGIRYPLKMIPLLLFQFIYKVIWITAIALPRWGEYSAMEMTTTMIIGAILDLVVIPWPFVIRAFIIEPGDRWRRKA